MERPRQSQTRRRGPGWRLRAMAQRTGGRLAILGGLVLVIWFGAAALATAAGVYPTFGEGTWRVLWHMIDPGALGDDLTTRQRVLGVVLTLTGLVILAGIILTVFTEALGRALERLAAADPPVVSTGHLLLIGANEILPAALRRLSIESRALGRPAPETVILLRPEQRQARDGLKRQLMAMRHRGDRPLRVIGGEIDGDGLDRAGADRAAGIVVLSDDGAPDASRADLGVIEAGSRLAIRFADRPVPPPVSLQMRNGHNVDAIWHAFPPEFDALVEDRAVAAMMLVTLLNPSFADTVLGTGADRVGGGAGIAIRPGLEGRTFASVATERTGERPIGILRGEGTTAEPVLVPAPDRRLDAGERLITVLDGQPASPPGTADFTDPGRFSGEAASVRIERIAARVERLLVIGWSSAVESLTRELASAIGLTELTVLAPTEPVGLPRTTEGLKTEYRAGRPDDPRDLGRAIELARPEAVIVAAAPLESSGAAFASMHLDRLLAENRSIESIAEQTSGENAERLRTALGRTTVISGAELIGVTVAESALNPELLTVREAMVDSSSARLDRFRVGLDGEHSLDLLGLHHAMVAAGRVPLSIARNGKVIELSDGLATAIADGDEVFGISRLTPPDP